MALVASTKQRPDFIISTGDNFYPNGLSSAEDSLFDKSFKNVYVGDALQLVQWYSVLGNHGACSPLLFVLFLHVSLQEKGDAMLFVFFFDAFN